MTSRHEGHSAQANLSERHLEAPQILGAKSVRAQEWWLGTGLSGLPCFLSV